MTYQNLEDALADALFSGKTLNGVFEVNQSMAFHDTRKVIVDAFL